MDNSFNLCPMCGGKIIINHNDRKWTCPDCGFDLYCNVAAAVGVIIADREHNVLFEVRAKEPRKGFIAIPGGFVDADESAENAAERECREETGETVTGIKYLCSDPNTYRYKNITYKTCDIFFTARPSDRTDSIPSLIKKLNGQKTEVLEFQSHRITCAADIEKLPIAFDSTKKALSVWLSSAEF